MTRDAFTLPDLKDPYFRIKHLSNKEDEDKQRGLRAILHGKPKSFASVLTRDLKLLADLKLTTPRTADECRLASLPRGSFFMSFPIKLAGRYLSRDDDVFYATENPVRKDKAFKVPLAAAASWKGNLRWVCLTRLNDWLIGGDEDGEKPDFKADRENAIEKFVERRVCLWRLFGDEKPEGGENNEIDTFLDDLPPVEAREDVKKKYWETLRKLCRAEENQHPRHQGRLRFFPTFFDNIDLAVLNPHSRATRVNANLVTLECAPRGAKGRFALLYIAPQHAGNGDKEARREEIAADMAEVGKAIRDMLRVYGFSAKKSSGFGTVFETLPRPEGDESGRKEDLSEYQPAFVVKPIDEGELIDHFAKKGTSKWKVGDVAEKIAAAANALKEGKL
ncbi:MAG: hypothetical protein C4523_08880 [Myxococcales bacterium]|nr:MAG: hypothetical protein C4523_08880 [Myxococcales bacterium]